VVRTITVPALATMIGGANWRPSKPTAAKAIRFSDARKARSTSCLVGKPRLLYRRQPPHEVRRSSRGQYLLQPQSQMEPERIAEGRRALCAVTQPTRFNLTGIAQTRWGQVGLVGEPHSVSHKHLSALSGTSTRTVSRASVGRKLVCFKRSLRAASRRPSSVRTGWLP